MPPCPFDKWKNRESRCLTPAGASCSSADRIICYVRVKVLMIERIEELGITTPPSSDPPTHGYIFNDKTLTIHSIKDSKKSVFMQF